MHYIVNVSGGLTSYEARRRTIATHGPDRVTSVFADTLIEDEDLYRFLIETHVPGGAPDLCAAALALPGIDAMDARKAALADLRRKTMARAPGLAWVADGRSPFDVWHDERAFTVRIAYGSGAAPCSKFLKRKAITRWLKTQAGPYTLVFGMDWSEIERMGRLVKTYAPTPVWCPLAEPPYLDKCHIAAQLERDGIAPPRLYADGFIHNNCGGGCVRAGIAHFANLHKTRPGVYAVWESEEERLRTALDKDIAILNERRSGVVSPLTLRALRERIASGRAYDRTAWGGCGCFADAAQARMDDLLMEVKPRGV